MDAVPGGCGACEVAPGTEAAATIAAAAIASAVPVRVTPAPLRTSRIAPPMSIGYTRRDGNPSEDRGTRDGHRLLRSPARTLHAVLHRDVGAFQLLRDARAAHPVHDRADRRRR